MASWSHKRKEKKKCLRCNIKNPKMQKLTGYWWMSIHHAVWSRRELISSPVCPHHKLIHCALKYPCPLFPNAAPKSQMKVVSASCKWSLIVIVLSGFHPHNPVTFAHRYLHTHPPPLPPIRVYGVNNKSCVTSQITQTAYHLFIVVYHNNSSLRTKATASQTQAFVNELGRLPDLKINWECCLFLSPSCDSCFPPETKYR